MSNGDDERDPCRPIVDADKARAMGAPTPVSEDTCRPIEDFCRPIVDPIRQARLFGIGIGFVIGFLVALLLMWFGVISF